MTTEGIDLLLGWFLQSKLQVVECVQDALDLIEFVSGPAESEWGSVRSQMGRSQAWDLKYFAIGNEVRTATHNSFT